MNEQQPLPKSLTPRVIILLMHMTAQGDPFKNYTAVQRDASAFRESLSYIKRLGLVSNWVCLGADWGKDRPKLTKLGQELVDKLRRLQLIESTDETV